MSGFPEFQSLLSFDLTPGQVVRHLVVAFLCGLLVSRFYAWITRRPVHSRTFTNSLIALTMVTAIVIMVIGNNLARAFGLVGAMSIIRFRTAVKDIQDIVFIFFSLTVGMAAGVGMYAVALLGSGLIGSIMLGLSRLGSYAQQKREYMVLMSFEPDGGDETPYLPVLKDHCRRHQLVNVKAQEESDILELSYYVHLKDEDRSDDLIRELRGLRGVKNASLFFDEEYY